MLIRGIRGRIINLWKTKNIRVIRVITSLWSVGLRRVSCSKTKSVLIRGIRGRLYHSWETKNIRVIRVIRVQKQNLC